MGIVFSTEYEKENGTPTVLLLGNGFDLQLGLKSRYEDFLLYLFFLKTLHHLSENKIVKHENDYLKVLIDGENEYYGVNESKNTKSKSKEIKENESANPNRDKDKIKFLSILEIAKKRLTSFEEENGGKLGILENNTLLSCIISILSQCNKNVALLPFGCCDPFNNLFPNNWKIIYDADKKISHENWLIEKHEEPTKTVELCVDDLRKRLQQYVIQIKGNSDKQDPSEINRETDMQNPSKINGWIDVESIIECLLTKNEHLIKRFSYNSNESNQNWKKNLSKYCDELNLKDNLENAYEKREALKQFTHEFCKFIQIQVEHIKEQDNFKESLKLELDKEIQLYKSGQDALFIEKVDLFSNIHSVLNYNYSSLSELFEEYSVMPLHVNGKSEDETAIFGINEDIAKETQDIQNKYSTYFYKQTQRVLNHVPCVNFEELGSLYHNYKFPKAVVPIKIEGFNLIIYGHSCSPADFDVIKTLLTHPNLRVAVVLCYNKEAMLSAYHNIRTMLGPQKIAEMMQVSSKMEKRLFFLERQES